MKICPKCKRENTDEATVCAHCGESLVDDASKQAEIPDTGPLVGTPEGISVESAAEGQAETRQVDQVEVIEAKETAVEEVETDDLSAAKRDAGVIEVKKCPNCKKDNKADEQICVYCGAPLFDVGTTKIVAVVGEMDAQGELYVIGHGQAPAQAAPARK